jgi:hypothetical protein
MYEARARAAAILSALSVGALAASLLTLQQVDNPPVLLQVLLGACIGLSSFMTVMFAAAWRINHKEGN